MAVTTRGLRAFPGFWRYKKSLITFLIFIAYAAVVFWSNYDSLQQLRNDALIRFQLESEKQAAAISYYFTERRNDIFELAESEPVVSFFKNRDLGMSYEYGLGVNVEFIEDRFSELMARKRVGGQAIYSGVVLIDNQGVEVAMVNRASTGAGYKALLAPGQRETRLRHFGQNGELLVSSPVWINQIYYGEILAWTNANTSLAQFGRLGPRWFSLLVDRQNAKPLDSGGTLSPWYPRLEKALKELSAAGQSSGFMPGNAGEEKLAITKVDIEQTPLAYVSMTFDYPAEKGSSRWMLFAAGGIPFIVLFLVFLDMRDRRRLDELSEQARAEAVRLAQARGEFLANMSHEIRTPMNAIVGMTELCLNTDLNSKQQNYLNKIQGASNSLLRIINDILDFSRIESGKLEIEQLPFDLDQVFEDIAALLAESAAQKSIELVFDVDDCIRQSYVGDPLRLEQILINLIGNAIKFSERGTITLRVRNEMIKVPTVRLSFSVIDQGIGLSSDQQVRLFQAFTQADSTTTRRYGGSGLGLTICKRLVELMGGSIRVSSALGQGSNFHFFVNLGVDRTHVSSAVAIEQRLLPFADSPVLVVTSNPVVQSAIAAQLSQIGLVSEPCLSAEEAMSTVFRREHASYLAILVDSSVLDDNGVAIFSRLRSRWGNAPVPPSLAPTSPLPTPVPPIILLSSVSQADLERYAGTFDGVLAKPTSPSRLFAEIAPFLGLKARARPLQNAHTSLALASLRGVEILMVDDVPLNQEVVRDMLESAGVRVRLANNGREAIEAIHKKMPDGVLMDCQMPVMDGYEATRELRKEERYRRLPIIALTANALHTERERCLDEGMDGYVAKPVKSRELLAVLVAHLPAQGFGRISHNSPAASPDDPSEAETLAETDFKARVKAGGETGTAVPAGNHFPELPGINLQTGLLYANGNHEIYRKILRMFCDSHGHDFEPSLTRAVENEDWVGAIRIAHTLKGSARTIGANLLGDLAQALEETFRAQKKDSIEQLLASLLLELEKVCAGLVEVGLDQYQSTPSVPTRNARAVLSGGK